MKKAFIVVICCILRVRSSFVATPPSLFQQRCFLQPFFVLEWPSLIFD